MPAVAKKFSKPKRGQTFPVPDWWLKRANDEVERLKAEKPRNFSQTKMAKAVGATQTAISRCLSGDVTTIKIVDKISQYLKLPRPIFIADSEMEALAVERIRQKLAEDTKLDEL